ncbi:MAG: hypothetical protein CO093_09870 [Alphaproteobacteria bacterium CG_4_9_14_3_um_filter_47_13]|nr:MAG: hypothetical protein CO093_09870 [Alphaproteobacteria bacterium CG_4_9_14_3_um_filter_47_13]
MKDKFFAIVAMLYVLTLAGQAMAAEPRLLGKYSDWEAYVFMEGDNKVCYMASQPAKSEGNYTRRGDVFALITHRPAEGSKNVFSYITGYSYKQGSDATAKIDSTSFTLFTQDETAWAPDAATDNKISEAIKKSSKMVIKGVSSRETATTDTFSLKGSSAAYEAISKECNVK